MAEKINNNIRDFYEKPNVTGKEDKKKKSIQGIIQEFAKKFGCNVDKNSKTCNAGFRDYNGNRQFMAYITKGQIDDENGDSGAYSGISYVVNPVRYNPRNFEFTCVVIICIGTNDLGDDAELASLPYMRRKFTKLVKKGQSAFFKTNFSDVETESTSLYEKLNELKNNDEQDNGCEESNILWDIDTISKYKNVLPASCIVKFTQDEAEEILNTKDPDDYKGNSEFLFLVGWLAQYAEIRNWRSGYGEKTEKEKIGFRTKYIDKIRKIDDYSEANDIKEVTRLLEDRHYVILQGAPGTGKTRLANTFANNECELKFKIDGVFFEQFHAETSYADFVGGIQPVLSGNTSQGVSYEYREGTLTRAIRAALGTTDNILLIIDEINRANLANVLGPVFYLFEKTTQSRQGKVRLNIEKQNSNYVIANDNNSNAKGYEDYIELSKLPDNLYVIATMNTADRSIAVVDFALRRRFAWYTTMPYKLTDTDEFYFNDEAFEKIKCIFEKYASDEELNLMPGQNYFMLNKNTVDAKQKEIEDRINKLNAEGSKSSGIDREAKEEIFKDRLKYELMPLMKEYFAENLVIKAQDEFADYYHEMTGEYMYK